MSFKLFFASTFGLIKSTAKIEAAHDALLADFRMFTEFENSPELKEFLELEQLVNSASFKQKKKEIQTLSLKGSKEAAQLAEFKKLAKNTRLHKYYTTLKSSDLKRFEQISASEMMAKYKEMKTAVERHSLDALKKMDKQSKEHVMYTEFLSLRDSSDLVFFRNFRKSSGYRNYELMLESAERKRYEELQKITESDEFKSRVAYLEDKNKWDKTEDAAREKRFSEMTKMPQVVNYQKYKNADDFHFFKKWDLVFEDRFNSSKLDSQKWITKSHWANETLGQNFSQVGDIHAFTDGKNISLDGKSLKLEVRKEKTKGMVWQIPFGFVEREFDYSAGIVTTAGSDWWNHGILEAKVKYAPSGHMVDAIYLLGEESSPQINLVEIGAKNRVGTLTKTESGIHSENASISGLKSGEFYIFRLEWSSDSLKWKVNNKELLTISLPVPSRSMHLNIASILISESHDQLPHKFEIEWVRFYQQHKS